MKPAPLLFAVLTAGLLGAQQAPKLPPLREQATIRQQWLSRRLNDVLPALMRKHKVSMWIVMMREYNEDPVFRSVVSPTVFSARRRTIYIFYDRGGAAGVERLALGGGDNGGLYTTIRDPEQKGRELYMQAGIKIPTPGLNKVAEKIKSLLPVAHRGAPIPKIYYVAQTGSFPPTITLMINNSALFSKQAIRYIQQQLRNELDINEVPIKILLKNKNRRK